MLCFSVFTFSVMGYLLCCRLIYAWGHFSSSEVKKLVWVGWPCLLSGRSKGAFALTRLDCQARKGSATVARAMQCGT